PGAAGVHDFEHLLSPGVHRTARRANAGSDDVGTAVVVLDELTVVVDDVEAESAGPVFKGRGRLDVRAHQGSAGRVVAVEGVVVVDAEVDRVARVVETGAGRWHQPVLEQFHRRAVLGGCETGPWALAQPASQPVHESLLANTGNRCSPKVGGR